MKASIRLFATILVCISMAAIGCSSGGSEDAPDAASQEKPDAGAEPIQPPTADSIKAAFEKAQAGETDVALSDDGRIRYRRTLSGGVPTREEVVVDGRTISLREHDGAQTRWSRDRDGDGTLEWVATIRREPVGEETVEIVISDAAGNPVRRETYSRSDDVISALVELADEEGTLQEDLSFETTPNQSADAVTGPTPGSEPGDCSNAQSLQLKAQMYGALAQGVRCAMNMGQMSVAAEIAAIATGRGIELRCGDLGGQSVAEINWWDAILQGNTTGPIVITVDPTLFFNYSEDTQRSILWHELLHVLNGPHNPFDISDPSKAGTVDQTYACANVCFNPDADKCQCASCLGTDVCDPRCAQFKECKPDQGAQCLCFFNMAWYPTEAECAVGCPSGLACFASSCRVRDYSCK